MRLGSYRLISAQPFYRVNNQGIFISFVLLVLEVLCSLYYGGRLSGVPQGRIIRSGVTRCTILMVLYFCRMCRCGLYAVPWSHIGILMRFIAAEPCSTAGHLSPLSVSQWNDLADPVFDGVGLAGFKTRANALFIGPTCLRPLCLLLFSISLLSFSRLLLWGWGLIYLFTYTLKHRTIKTHNSNYQCIDSTLFNTTIPC